jgi:hypothetical protein
MKSKIKNLSNVLKDVHKRFLEQERLQAEQFFNKKITPFEFLLMLTQDKNFLWLQPFSALIAEIDAFADESETFSNEELLEIKKRIDFLIKDPSSSVVDRYNHHLNNDAAFIMLHSNLKNELNNFNVGTN